MYSKIEKNSHIYKNGNRKENIAECQLWNKLRCLQTHIFNQHLSDTSVGNNCEQACGDNIFSLLV